MVSSKRQSFWRCAWPKSVHHRESHQGHAQHQRRNGVSSNMKTWRERSVAFLGWRWYQTRCIEAASSARIERPMPSQVCVDGQQNVFCFSTTAVATSSAFPWYGFSLHSCSCLYFKPHRLLQRCAQGLDRQVATDPRSSCARGNKKPGSMTQA